MEDNSELDAEQEEDMEADAASDTEQDQQESEFDIAHFECEFQQEGEVVTGFYISSPLKWLQFTVKMKPKSTAWRRQGLPSEGAVLLDGHSKQIAAPSLLKSSLPGT